MKAMAAVAVFYLMIIEPLIALDGSTFLPLTFPEEATEVYGKVMLHPEPSTERLSKFYLYTPKSPKKGRVLDARNMRTLSDFNPSLETKVIIHGFLDAVLIAQWMHDMKDEFLISGDYNVIIVDWSNGNFIPYSKAAANTQKVGDEISHLLDTLQDKLQAEPGTIHLIGHSLGAHAAGYVGERIKGIGRITGLDPALYRFSKASPRHRLDTSDAKFVDVIHTDAGGIGLVNPVGHVDFYPNGGSVQPGCTATNSIMSLIQDGLVEGFRTIICSHMRAPMLFTESINSRGCQMLGIQCDSWDGFLNGNCSHCGVRGERCAAMGHKADAMIRNNSLSQSFYLATASRPPYCAHEYMISVKFERDDLLLKNLLPKWRRNDNTIITLTVLGSHGKAEFDLSNKLQNLPVETVTYVMPCSVYLGTIDGAVAKWHLDGIQKVVELLSSIIGKETFPQLKKVDISLLKDMKSMRSESDTASLCSRGESVDPYQPILLKKRFCS